MEMINETNQTLENTRLVGFKYALEVAVREKDMEIIGKLKNIKTSFSMPLDDEVEI